jgi:hypothetical protein
MEVVSRLARNGESSEGTAEWGSSSYRLDVWPEGSGENVKYEGSSHSAAECLECEKLIPKRCSLFQREENTT